MRVKLYSMSALELASPSAASVAAVRNDAALALEGSAAHPLPAPPGRARFVHLRLHSEYSIVDGTLRIDDAVAAAVADNMPALALTDLANVFGLVKFYTAARKAGVK